MSDNLDMPLLDDFWMDEESPPEDLDEKLEFDDEEHEYRWEGDVVPSVTQILDKLGLYGDMSMIDPEVLEASRIRGRAAHEALEKIVLGMPVDFESIPESAVPYIDSFVEWWVDVDFELILSEELVYHPDLVYAGRLDLAIGMDGDNWVIDAKTRRRSANDGLQLAAYTMAAGHKIGSHNIRIGVLELQKDGRKAKLKEYPILQCFKAWRSTVELYDFKHRKGWLAK